MHCVCVIDRHADLEGIIARVLVAISDRQYIREDHRMANPPIIGILRVAREQPVLGYSVFKLAKRDLFVMRADRDFDPFLLFDKFILVPVQPLSMNRIERIFHYLEPAHWNEGAAEHLYRSLRNKSVVTRK